MIKPTSSTVVIVLLLGVLIGVGFSNILTARSSAQPNGYTYGHLAFVQDGSGLLAIDLQNGDTWHVFASWPEQQPSGLNPPRTSKVDPSYQGNLGLDRLRQAKQEMLERLRR